MEGFATSTMATTTCAYFYDGVDTRIASTSCATLTSEATSSAVVISTDPVLAVIMAGILLVLSAVYVRRVFFS